MDETTEVQHQIRRVRRTRAQIAADNADMRAVAEVVATVDLDAQALALRIWNGQSPDLLHQERVARVTAGVEGQGMSMEGVVLPA